MKITMILAALLACFQISNARTIQAERTVISVAKSVTPSFSFVRGHRQGKGTSVTWAMDSNDQIVSFDIECTTQDPTDPYSVWEFKGSVSASRSHMFTFKDTMVLPGILNYRITAYLADGTSVTSAIESVRLVSR